MRLIKSSTGIEKEFAVNSDCDASREKFDHILYDMRYLTEQLGSLPGILPPAGYTSENTYWLVNDSKKEILGIGRLKVFVSKDLARSGGQISFYINEQSRNAGCEDFILSSLLERAGEMGVEQAFIAAGSDDETMIQQIMRYGGILDKTYISGQGTEIRKYKIKIPKNLKSMQGF